MVDACTCVTCGDTAVEAVVREVLGDVAVVEAEGSRERVAIELVAPVTVGERLICHAGIAIAKTAQSGP